MISLCIDFAMKTASMFVQQIYLHTMQQIYFTIVDRPMPE